MASEEADLHPPPDGAVSPIRAAFLAAYRQESGPPPWHESNCHDSLHDSCTACLAHEEATTALGWLLSDLEELWAFASRRAFRRALPHLMGPALLEYAAEIGAGYRDLDVIAARGPLTSEDLHTWDMATWPARHEVMLALLVLRGSVSPDSDLCPREEDRRFVRCVLGWLTANERIDIKAGDLAALVREALHRFWSLARQVDRLVSPQVIGPVVRPAATPGVPHGPPAFGPGPRLCAA